MPCDMFIKMDGIKGDSTDDKHKDWIEVLSFSHAISQATGGASSAQGTHAGGRADHQDFNFSKRLDSASPILSLHCCTAKPIPEIIFECCRAMGEKTTFMKFKLKDSIVSTVSPAGAAEAGDLVPIEQVGLRYGEIHWEYTPTDPRSGGKAGAAIKSAWSTLENKPL